MAAMIGIAVKTLIGGNAYEVLREAKSWCEEGSRGRSKKEWQVKCNVARQELAGCNRMMVVAALVSVCVSTILGGLFSSLLAVGSVVGLALIEDSQDVIRKVKGLHMGSEGELANHLYQTTVVEDRVALMTADCLLLNKVGAEFLMNVAGFIGMGSVDQPSGVSLPNLASLLSVLR